LLKIAQCQAATLSQKIRRRIPQSAVKKASAKIPTPFETAPRNARRAAF